MSEQSGGGPITREQVERAIKAAEHGYMDPWISYFGADWRGVVPRYVLAAYGDDSGGWETAAAALTRWRDELAAAEPVRRVARWDAELEAYALTPTHDDGALMTHAVEDAAKARAWGYTIEGGPEPIDDTAPERLRERREALGWTTAYAGHWVPWFNHTDVERAECGRGVPAFVARYAAALSAEEARLAEEERLACAYRESDGTLVWDDSPLPEPERPAPRFKVGDLDPALRETALAATRMLRCGKWPLSLPRVRELPGFDAWNSGPLTSTDWIAQLEALLDEPASPPAPEVVPRGWTRHASGSYWCLHCNATGDAPGDQDCSNCGGLGWRGEPGAPPEPAPEVVDVPQPRIVVKRCDEVEAEWTSADATILIVTHDALDDAIFVPIALLRAMLADIDAQQQPDPQPDLDEGWRVVSGDTAFAMPFGTIRECSRCGCLVGGGPTACLRCIDAQQGGAS